MMAACHSSPVPAEWTVDLVQEFALGSEPVTLDTAFFQPSALGFDHTGRLYVLDRGNHRVQIFEADGRFVQSLGGPGEGPGQLSSPTGMWVHPDGSVLVADTRNRRLQPFGASGSILDPIAVDFFPIDVVATHNRLFVLRLPRASMVLGPDPRPLVQVLDRSGRPIDGFVEATPTSAGALYLLENALALAPAPDGGIAASNLYLASRIRLYRPSGKLRREIPVLYKAGPWAPLGRRPSMLNEASIQRVARTASDLAWDPVRRLYWVLAGYVDQTPEGEWVIGQELYRYDVEGHYRGSAMLPFRGLVVAGGPDSRVWVIDIDGVVHAFRVRDTDMKPR
ncbi:MAG: NHL repeat-containing protein [Acidobacteriota bacterium]